jgi:hypothetical protein
MQAIVDTAVQSDLNKFYSYSNFQNGMTTNVSVGSYSVAGISNLMGPRVTYLQSTPEFGYSTPLISLVNASPALPAYNSSVAITGQVTNASQVYLGYRFSKTDKFVRVLMYDDGAHNDGAAGDNVYGANIIMLSGQMQYYIYAENSNAGMFSPQRAEHEFYSLRAQSYQPVIGNLVINEILADNTAKEKDEYGEREDWIELYNNSTSLLDLSSLYLSDDIAQMQKWKMPDSTTLIPGGYLIVWADKDSLQKTFHTNFSLSKTADVVILSNSGGSVLDSISFSNQWPNISFGRYPNGTGPFGQMPTTFDAHNTQSIGIAEVETKTAILAYPNPGNDLIHLLNNRGPARVEIRNSLGQLIFEETFSGEISVNASAWAAGVYFIRSGAYNQKIIIQH